LPLLVIPFFPENPAEGKPGVFDYSQFKLLEDRLDGLHVNDNTVTIWEVKEGGA
jgi:hypothetical protein